MSSALIITKWTGPKSNPYLCKHTKRGKVNHRIYLIILLTNEVLFRKKFTSVNFKVDWTASSSAMFSQCLFWWIYCLQLRWARAHIFVYIDVSAALSLHQYVSLHQHTHNDEGSENIADEKTVQSNENCTLTSRLYVRYRSSSPKTKHRSSKSLRTTSFYYFNAKSAPKVTLTFNKFEKIELENFDFVHLLFSSLGKGSEQYCYFEKFPP